MNLFNNFDGGDNCDDIIFDDESSYNDKFEINSDLTNEITAEKLLLPQNNDFCLGHEYIENQLLDLYKKNSIPHAMIFSGLRGIGKATMAFRFARFLLKNGNGDDSFGLGNESLFCDRLPSDLCFKTMDIERSDSVFAQISAGSHPDFRYVERGFNSDKGKLDKDIKIDIVRKIEPFLRMKSSSGGWRIVIIEDADTMNRNAQNAILKILEEPPPKVLLILIVHRLGAIIPTIRSRSRLISFNPLSEININILLSRKKIVLSREDLALLHKMACGSIGHAIKIAEEGGLEMIKTILQLLDDPVFPNWVNIHAVSNELSLASQDKDYKLFCEGFEWIFKETLRAKTLGTNYSPQYLSNDRLNRIIQNSSVQKLVKICSDLNSLYTRTDFSNLDRRDAVRGSFLVVNQ